MNGKKQNASDDVMKEEYDFSEGVRGQYADRLKEGANVVVLDPDVAALFPDSASVNAALREFARLSRKHNQKRVPDRA